MTFLYQDADLVVVDKPAGHFVHPPRFADQHKFYAQKPVPRSLICLYHVRDTVKQKVFPVHRLDVATSGILIFAKSSEIASILARQFAARRVEKTYKALVRGYTELQGEINFPLNSHSTATEVSARTTFHRQARLELPYAVGHRYPTARYSLLEVQPHTGRYHQIRRHFNRIAHPLIGDGTHGDSRHNIFFREKLGIESLCLRAHKIAFTHPRSGLELLLQAPSIEKWQRIEALPWQWDGA